jgi:hypothetical protein
MRLETIKDAVHAEPFRPFVVHLADGRSAHVPAADFVSINPRGRTVLIWTEQGGFRVIDMPLITEIAFEEG